MQTAASGRHRCDGECDAGKFCLKSGACEVSGFNLPPMTVDKRSWPAVCPIVRAKYPGAWEIFCVEAYSICPLSIIDEDTQLLFAICQGIDYGNRIATYDDLMAQPWWLVDASRIISVELNRIKEEREANRGNESGKS